MVVIQVSEEVRAGKVVRTNWLGSVVVVTLVSVELGARTSWQGSVAVVIQVSVGVRIHSQDLVEVLVLGILQVCRLKKIIFLIYSSFQFYVLYFIFI